MADAESRQLRIIREQIEVATSARKCFGCGCFHSAVEAFENTGLSPGELGPVLARARAAFTPKQYDCLGCAVCYPAVAANAFTEAFREQGATLNLCQMDSPSQRRGWPPLPGDYHTVRFRAPVAVCTLNSDGLAKRLAQRSPEGLAIAGTMRTENLGIERIIRNVLANPHIRFLVVCGDDAQQAVGHLSGQSLASLFKGGLDERGRIRGARGKRPVLKNVTRNQADAFLRQVQLVASIGVEDEDTVVDLVQSCVARDPGPFEGAPADAAVETVQAEEPRRSAPDPAGYFVIYPDALRRHLTVEHYTNDGVLDCVTEGQTPEALYSSAIERNLVSTLDHAAYLGRELALAARSMRTGEPYVQDRAPGELLAEPASEPCGCPTAPPLPLRFDSTHA